MMSIRGGWGSVSLGHDESAQCGRVRRAARRALAMKRETGMIDSLITRGCDAGICGLQTYMVAVDEVLR